MSRYVFHCSQRHACYQDICIFPTELVGHSCRHIIAELHDAKDVTINHRHENGACMVVFIGSFRRGRLMQKHVERLNARQVGCYDKGGVQHQRYADEARQEAAQH